MSSLAGLLANIDEATSVHNYVLDDCRLTIGSRLTLVIHYTYSLLFVHNSKRSSLRTLTH